MDTADVNFDLTMLSLEDIAINKFTKLINIHKSEIITRFRQLHYILDTKQTSLINELDHLRTNISTHIQTRGDQVRQLRKAREQVQAELTHNKLNTVLESTLKQLQDNVDKLENETLCMQTVDIRWDTSNYSTVINNICKVEILSYSDRTQPIWSTVSQGMGHNQLYAPFGLSVDQDSGNIYVADSVAHRIQIYDSIGEYVRTIKTKNYKPFHILLDTEYFYVYSFHNNLIKINKICGDIVNTVEINNYGLIRNSFVIIAGMCLDVLNSNSIFLCMNNCDIVLVHNKTDLKETNIIQLNMQYYTNLKTPRDIKLLPTEMIILFTGTDYPLQCFNREGVLLRKIISKQQINHAFYFCIDMYNNYIISDRYDYNIKIFTPSGKLITSIGKPGQDIGQFDKPQGICLDLNNRIIICDRKNNYVLQAF